MGADRDWLLRAGTDKIGLYEEFTLLCRDNGKIALQTNHKTEDGKPRYVTPLGADFDWRLIAKTDTILLWEEFTLLDVDTGQRRPCLEVIELLRNDGQATVAFQTWHTKEGKNRLVTAMDAGWDWILRAETNELKASEKFTMMLLP
jgi:hypothetical protein